ncbi:MAG: hypothetical protein Q8R82_22090, partial [Hyphomonadaceae bacterium]|nr:hypothetical protein [Hyphomonadaceae bacterium]
MGIARRSTRYDAAHAVQAHDKTHKESQKTQVAWALFLKGSPQIGLGQSFTRAHHGPTDGAQHARSSLPDPTALLASACNYCEPKGAGRDARQKPATSTRTTI